MTTHRFYLPPGRWNEERPELDPSDSHHCADVLRLAAGKGVVIFDGEGNEAGAELLEVGRKHTRISIGPRITTPKPRCSITLAQAVPKARNMDMIIQKAVELGASAVTPILSERTVVRIEDGGDAEKKRERWQSIAIEACKQCGQNRVPRISLPVTPKQFLHRPPEADLLLIASLLPEARPVKEVLAAHAAAKGAPPASVVVMVGPEGDFTPEEHALAKAAGAVALTLGPLVLRTETAALYCLSVLGHELL
jgi:16S rRNA (uracil1498-N3)-methyltransferase